MITAPRYSYDKARTLLRQVITDFQILSGDELGPSDATWQTIAKGAATGLHTLAFMLEAASMGRVSDGPVVFPSPEDLGDD